MSWTSRTRISRRTFFLFLLSLAPFAAKAVGLGARFRRKPAPERRGVPTTISQSSNTSITIAKPSNVKITDMLYAFVWTNTYSSTASIPTPSGWTLVGSQSHQTNQYILWVFRRQVDGSEPANITITFSETVNYSAGTLVAYSKVHLTTPEDTTPVFTVGNVATSSVAINGLTTVSPYSQVIACLFETSRASTLTTPTGFTKIGSQVDATNAQSLYLYDKNYRSTQATGTVTTTGWNTSTNRYLGVVIALRPC